MKIEKITNNKWWEILSKQKHYSFFQTPDYSSIYCKNFTKYSEFHQLLITDSGKEILIPLVKVSYLYPLKQIAYNLLSLPYGAYGGILSVSELTQEELAAVNQHLVQICSMGVMIVHSPKSPLKLNGDFQNLQKETLMIPLDKGYDEIWSNRWSSNLRSKIRRADRKDVDIFETKEEPILTEYLALSEESMKKWSPKERHPIGLLRDLIQHEKSQLWTARIEGQLTAGALILSGKDDLFFFQGALSRDFSSSYPMNLLFDRIIRKGIEEGYQILNLGSSGGIESVKNFKLSLNPDRVNYTAEIYTPAFWKIIKSIKRM